jgi:anaerobic selenocysteine-containing dehydrogenase
MHLRDFARSGHPPTLFSAFLYFDISFMVWVLIGALGVYIARDFGLTASQKGLLVAIPILGGSLFRIPMGLLTDRIGPKKTGMLGQLIVLLPLVWGWRFGNDLPQLMALGLLLGVAGASFAVALPLASRWYPLRHQGLAMGIAGAGNSGTVLASLFAPRLAEGVGWHGVFGLALLPVVLTLALYLMLAKDSPEQPVPKPWQTYFAVLQEADTWWFKVIVVDPRRTETTDIADVHLPIRPGADIALLNAMLSVLVEQGLVDQEFIAAHTQGWQELRAHLAPYAPEAVQEVCGLSARHIREAALLFGQARRVLSLWSMGVNQSTAGVQKNQAIINLHLATGQIAKPGAGPFSLTGQPNAMGGREVGGLSHLLPGYRSVLDPQHRAEVAALWGVPPEHLAATPGYTAVELFHALVEGKVKAVWIMGTNPAVSMPNLDVVEKGLRQAELVVVQDAYHPTDTTRFADVLLPAAQWPEKEGVMTNSERTLTYLPRLVDPPGEALPDWQILTWFARELGFREAFAFAAAEEVFEEFKRFTTGRLMDISGVSYARLLQAPVQWPCPTPDHPGTARLYSDGRFPTPDGRARFIPVEHVDPVERPSRDYPLILTTGRVKHQWHTMTRTGKVENLLKSCREPFVELHPQDARRCGVQDGDFVELTSRRGKLVAQARVTAEIASGTCFVPFHWGRRMGFYKCVNNLTLDTFDPISKEPELKAAAVRVKKLEVFPLPLGEGERVRPDSEVS